MTQPGLKPRPLAPETSALTIRPPHLPYHEHIGVPIRKSQKDPRQRKKLRASAIEYLAISEPQLNEIKEETANDSTFQILKHVILKGWPDNKASVPFEVIPYFNIREELTVQDGIVFKGPRCIIPQSLRKKVKEKIHILEFKVV